MFTKSKRDTTYQRKISQRVYEALRFRENKKHYYHILIRLSLCKKILGNIHKEAKRGFAEEKTKKYYYHFLILFSFTSLCENIFARNKFHAYGIDKHLCGENVHSA